MELEFTELSTESRYDTVRVCYGSCCDSGAVMAELSGQLEASNLRYQSTGTSVTVEFTSDGSVGGRGFQANYASVSIPTSSPGVYWWC